MEEKDKNAPKKKKYQRLKSEQKAPYRPWDKKKCKLITHDKFFKAIFRRKKVAQGFLRAVLPCETVEILDLDALEVLPKDFLTLHFKSLHADMVYRVPLKNKNGEKVGTIHFYIILEHKSSDEYWVTYQIIRYVYQLEFDLVDEAEKNEILTNLYLIPAVLPIIIYHGEAKFSAPTNVGEYHQVLPGYSPSDISRKVQVIDLSLIPDDDLPKDERCPELNASLKLMKYIFQKNFPEILREVLQSLLPYSDRPGYEYDNYLIWRYALGRAKYGKKQEFRRIAKELPNQNITEEEMSGILMRAMKKGVKKGRKQGEKRGVKKERKRGKVEVILLFLSQLGEVPPSLVERLNAIDPKNTDQLNELLLFAPKCKTFDEFEKML